MRTWFTLVFGFAGFLYGFWAVLLVYHEAPLNLQSFIVGAVAAVGVSVGWLLGLLLNSLPKMSREVARRRD